jgi:hypothetical protein
MPFNGSFKPFIRPPRSIQDNLTWLVHFLASFNVEPANKLGLFEFANWDWQVSICSLQTKVKFSSEQCRGIQVKTVPKSLGED